MKKILMTLAAVLCCAMTTTVFTACGSNDDDNNDVSTGPANFTYKLTVMPGTGADDQQDIVKTVVTAPNHTGVMEDHEFSEYLESMSVQPTLPITTLPSSNEIVINQTILPDADITSKEEYQVGLHYKLEVTSYDSNGKVIDYIMKEDNPCMEAPAGNLNKLYPMTTTLKFTVSKAGKITI